MSKKLSKELSQAALEYHQYPKPGKIKVTPTTSLLTQRDLSLAYTPGVAAASLAIVDEPEDAAKYTIRSNLVGVVTNGSAVLGLGNIGALAAKPVMEGKAELFQKFAGIDVFDIEVNETDPEKLVDIIESLEPTFGGINLEDIKAPECFVVEGKLKERMGIPVFHDDQHGTAIVVGAAVVNALEIAGKDIEDVKLATVGMGAAGTACVDMLVSLGLKPENILAADIDGVLSTKRKNLDPNKQRYARETDCETLADIVKDADVFLGLSAAGVLTQDMVKTMADDPIIMALANPSPEITPSDAKEVRPDAIIATGRSDFPNQVNNALCFPYLFRGALDVGASAINEEMKVACVHAIAELARLESSDVAAEAYGIEPLRFGRDYLIPQPFDPRLVIHLPPAIAQAAMDSGVARRPIEDFTAYRDELTAFVFRTGLVMKPIYERAKADMRRVVYAEGEEEVTLRAVQTVVDEGLAKPILVGRPEVIADRIKRAGLRLQEGRDFELVNILFDPRFEEYWQHYHQVMERKGVTPSLAKAIIRSHATAIAAVMVARGEADSMICGLVGPYHEQLETIRNVIGVKPGVTSLSAMMAVATEKGLFFFLDAYVHDRPSPKEMADATLIAVERLQRLFHVDPHVALLSHSNFGSSDTEDTIKMRAALKLIRERSPELEVEGEMQADMALNPRLRERLFPNSHMSGKANVFVFPSLDAANIAYNMTRVMTDGVAIGPILMGTRLSAQILTPQASSRRVVNMTALACVEAQINQEQPSSEDTN